MQKLLSIGLHFAWARGVGRSTMALNLFRILSLFFSNLNNIQKILFAYRVRPVRKKQQDGNFIKSEAI